MISFEDWLQSLPRLEDPLGVAEKLKEQGYGTVRKLVTAQPEAIIKSTGLPAFQARYICVAAQGEQKLHTHRHLVSTA